MKDIKKGKKEVCKKGVCLKDIKKGERKECLKGIKKGERKDKESVFRTLHLVCFAIIALVRWVRII